MSIPALPAAIGRFKQLALRSNDVWQGGVFRLPTWIDDGPGGRPYRPWGGIWVSERTGFVHLEPEPAFDAHGHELGLRALLEFGLRDQEHLAGRAARLRVTDPELAAFLAAQLDDVETVVDVVDDLPAVRDALKDLAQELAGDDPIAGILAATGVTFERVRAFADAAASFYAAAPWDHLQNEDLIVVEVPKWPRYLSRLIVMGNAGINYGLAFFDSRAAFERMAFAGAGPVPPVREESWAVHFGPVDEIPIEDSESWERHALPLAGERAYPFPVRMGLSGAVKRPGARELACLEALLRALAVTTEDQLDAGAWTVEVATADGPMAVTMKLPLLLEAEGDAAKSVARRDPDRRAIERTTARIHRFMKDKEFASLEDANRALAEAQRSGLLDDDVAGGTEGLTPLERAQEIVYDAAEVVGRLRVKRARQALEVSPDCADAWVMLAEAASSAARARDLYARAVDAGRHVLGPEAFEELAGHFWGHLETRPYMRARFGLAGQLQRLGDREAAAGHYQALLRLNPSDNQGVRYVLLALLLTLGRDAEAERLLGEYEGDVAAEWRYGRALLMYRRHGDGWPAREALRRAVEANPYVVRFLLHPERVPFGLPSHYTFGSPEEAASCVHGLREAVEATPGALAWVGQQASRESRTAGGRPKAERGRGGRRR